MSNAQLLLSSSDLFFFSAHAYIDPNTGGMLFQMLAVILALFSGVVFFFSRQIKTLFARVRRMIARKNPGNDND